MDVPDQRLGVLYIGFDFPATFQLERPFPTKSVDNWAKTVDNHSLLWKTSFMILFPIIGSGLYMGSIYHSIPYMESSHYQIFFAHGQK